MTYYSMIAGWVLAYAWFFLVGDYARGGVAPAVAKFQGFIADSRAVTLWQAGFLLLVAAISARGVNRGVEFINRIRAPALLALMLVLAAYALSAGDVARGLHFAFAPDLHRLTAPILLAAVGQALYALGISAGIMITYGAYMAPGESLRRNVLAVVGSIFTVSLLATVIIFPLVFRYGLNPAQGPELVFQVLPVAFAQMPGGRLFGTLFFMLLVLAALTPSVGLLEVPVVMAVGARRHAPRPRRAADRRGGAAVGPGFGAVLCPAGELASARCRARRRTPQFLRPRRLHIGQRPDALVRAAGEPVRRLARARARAAGGVQRPRATDATPAGVRACATCARSASRAVMIVGLWS